MLFSDWAFMTTWLWIHILAVPTLQNALGLKSMYAVFALHWASQIMFHRNLNKILAHHLKNKHGLLAAEKPRSRVSQKSRVWTKIGGLLGSFLRILSLFLATWSKPEPFQLRPSWVARLLVYTVLLDFLFYWSHRLQHRNKTLYKYVHAMHHSMKMPNVFSTVHDTVFEKIFNTFIQCWIMNHVVPMSFWELHAAYYTIHLVECLGHSGINAHLTNPCLPFLTAFGVELTVEDHDLHHRKFSGNFGKQTRLWDRLFGTYLPREETILA